MNSAVLQIVPDEVVIPDRQAQRRTLALSKVIGQINKLEAVEHEVIALLPSLSDAEVIETRNSARLLFASSWKIEIACDAELWDRAERSAGGRGNKDVNEKGILAAVNKRAQELGCGASTIRNNAQLYRRFESVLSTQQPLDDKGFFQAALASDDPDAMVEEFIKERLNNPHFRVSDAWRKVKAPPEGPKEDETKVLQSPEVQEWFQTLYAAILPHIATVPDTAPYLKIMARSIAGVVLNQSERTVEGDDRLIMRAIEETGGVSGDDLYDWQVRHFHFMSEEQLENRLLVLVAEKQLVEEDAGKAGKQVRRRGKLPMWYSPYYVKHKKREMCKKCGEWHRDPADCMEP